MTTQARSGGCMCGAVRFETQGEPLWVAYCHCRSCRRHTGAPVTVYVGFRREQVSFRPDEPPAYVSSPGVRRRFCPACGTPLSYEGDDHEGELHLHISGFDDSDEDAIEPERHVFYSERPPWLHLADDLPRQG